MGREEDGVIVPPVGEYWAKAAPPLDADLENCRAQDGPSRGFDNAALMHAESSFRARWATFFPRVLPPYYHLLEESHLGNPPRFEVNVEGMGDIEASVSSVEFAAMASTLVPLIRARRYGPTVSVLEIGGGYGGFAAACLRATMDIGAWTIVDIPSVARISRYCLKPWEDRVDVISPEEFADWDHACFDVVVQTRGFMEMSERELGFYFDLIQKRAKPGVLFYTINRRQKVSLLDEYPFDRHWFVTRSVPWPEGDMIEAVLVRTRDTQPSVAVQLGLKEAD